MLPSHVRELAHMAMDPDVPPLKISAAIAHDPVLAVQVIRASNTAAQAPTVRITTLEDAVLRIGTQSARNIVIAGCLSAQIVDPRIYGRAGRAIVDHSIGTAFLAAALAGPAGRAGELFLGGLLHDIGKLLVLKLAHDFGARTNTPPPPDEVDALCAAKHAAMGGWLAGRWEMPTSLSDPVIWHHDPEWAEDKAPVLVVYAANRLAHRYGFGCDADDADLLADPTMAEAGIDAARLAHFDATARDMYDEARSIMAA